MKWFLINNMEAIQLIILRYSKRIQRSLFTVDLER